MQRVTSAAGARIWQTFADLPQSDSPEDHARTHRLVAQYCDAAGLSKSKLPSKPNALSPHAHVVKDMSAHLKKWTALFPATADLRSWLVTSPLPEQRVPTAPTETPVEEEFEHLFSES